jgi:hypothetical protein
MLVYGVYDAIEALRVGATGPADVSNGPALAIQTALWVIFGLGMLWIARGWWTRSRWARGPFVLAQLIAGFVGFDLAGSAGAVEHWAGIAVCLLAVLGLVVTFSPPMIRFYAE